MDLAYAVLAFVFCIIVGGYLMEYGEELLDKPVDWIMDILWPEE